MFPVRAGNRAMKEQMIETEPAAQDGEEIRDFGLTADEASLACGGNMRETIRALTPANGYLEDETTKISYSYARRALRDRPAG